MYTLDFSPEGDPPIEPQVQIALNRGVTALESNRDGLNEIIDRACGKGNKAIKNIGCLVLETPLEPSPGSYYHAPNGAPLAEALNGVPVSYADIRNAAVPRTMYCPISTWKPTEASFSRYIYSFARALAAFNLSSREMCEELFVRGWKWKGAGLGLGLVYEVFAQNDAAIPSLGEQILVDAPYPGAALLGAVTGAAFGRQIKKERAIRAASSNPPIRVHHDPVKIKT